MCSSVYLLKLQQYRHHNYNIRVGYITLPLYACLTVVIIIALNAYVQHAYHYICHWIHTHVPAYSAHYSLSLCDSIIHPRRYRILRSTKTALPANKEYLDEFSNADANCLTLPTHMTSTFLTSSSPLLPFCTLITNVDAPRFYTRS